MKESVKPTLRTYEGKVASLSTGRAIIVVNLGGVNVALQKSDPALPLIRKAKEKGRRVYCVFASLSGCGAVSEVLTLYISPRGQQFSKLKKEVMKFVEHHITLLEAVEAYTPTYMIK